MVFTQRTIFGLTTLLLLSKPALGSDLSALQARIQAAEPNSTILVESGVYEGDIVIDKPMILTGRGWPVIKGSGKGKVVSIKAEGVTFSGFVVTGSGSNLSEDQAGIHVTANRAVVSENEIRDSLHGIYLRKVKHCQVLRNKISGKTSLPPPINPGSEKIVSDSPDLCAAELNINERGNGIHLWNSEENVVEENAIEGTRDGIYFSFTNHTAVRRNHISNVRYGLHYMYSDNNTFEHNTFSNNVAGAAMMFSKGLVIRENQFTASRGFRGYGMLLNSVDASRLERNCFNGNTVGIYLENSNGNVLEGNQIVRNYVGIRLTSSSDLNRFTLNRFTDNMHPAELAGQRESNRWSAAGVGNYWANATPLDIDQNQIGDLKHREPDLLGRLRRPMPAVGLLSGSPALGLLRFAHTRAALSQIQAIVDPNPLAPGYKP